MELPLDRPNAPKPPATGYGHGSSRRRPTVPPPPWHRQPLAAQHGVLSPNGNRSQSTNDHHPFPAITVQFLGAGLARDRDKSPRDTPGLCCDEQSPRQRHDRLGRCGADEPLVLELWDASVHDATNSLPLHCPIPDGASPPAPIDPLAAGPPTSDPVPTNQRSADPPTAGPDSPSNRAWVAPVAKPAAAQPADPKPLHSPSPLRTNS